MLEPVNKSDTAFGLSQGAGRTENNRRLGLAALAARRKGADGDPSPLSRVSANLSKKFSASEPDMAPGTTANSADDSLAVAPQDVSAGASQATPPIQDSAAPLRPQPQVVPLEPSTVVRDAARAERSQIGLAAVAASRRAAASRANVVQGGQSLSVLRDTSPNVPKLGSSVLQPDGGKRSTSLFDLQSSGEGLVNRLRGQVRPYSPLNASPINLGTDRISGRLGALNSGGPGSGGLDSSSNSGLGSLSGANAQRASLSASLHKNDNSSRLLLSSANPNRTPGGFGQSDINRSAFDLIG